MTNWELEFGDQNAPAEVRAVAALYNEPYYLMLRVNTYPWRQNSTTMRYLTEVWWARRMPLGRSGYDAKWIWMYRDKDLAKNLVANLRPLFIEEIPKFLLEFDFHCGFED